MIAHRDIGDHLRGILRPETMDFKKRLDLHDLWSPYFIVGWFIFASLDHEYFNYLPLL